jgi:hypothetical protein
MTVYEDINSNGSKDKIDIIVAAVIKATGIPQIMVGRGLNIHIKDMRGDIIMSFDYNIVNDGDPEDERISLLLIKQIDTDLAKNIIEGLRNDQKFWDVIDYMVACDIPESQAAIFETWQPLPDKYESLFDITGGEEKSIGSKWRKVVDVVALADIPPATCEKCGHMSNTATAKFRIGHEIKMEIVQDKGAEYGYDTTDLRKKYNIPSHIELEDFEILCPKCHSDKFFPKRPVTFDKGGE